jgi:hypothetical protein
MLDLDSFLVSLYVLVDDWWKLDHASQPPKTGRPPLLSDPEVITLAILAQWPRFRSERDFWRFASSHLRSYFPTLCSQSQLKVGASEPWNRSCASCSVPSPKSSPVLRPSFSRYGHDPRPCHREGKGFSQGTLRGAGYLREERLQDRVGLRLQGGFGGRPGRRNHRFRSGPCGLRREAHRGGP